MKSQIFTIVSTAFIQLTVSLPRSLYSNPLVSCQPLNTQVLNVFAGDNLIPSLEESVRQLCNSLSLDLQSNVISSQLKRQSFPLLLFCFVIFLNNKTCHPMFYMFFFILFSIYFTELERTMSHKARDFCLLVLTVVFLEFKQIIDTCLMNE